MPIGCLELSMPEISDRRFPNVSAGLISKQGMIQHHENYATMSILCQWLIHSNIRHVNWSTKLPFLTLRDSFFPSYMHESKGK